MRLDALRVNPYVILLIFLSVLVGGLMVAGCRKKATPPAPPKDAVAVQNKEPAPVANPFPDVAGKAVEKIADTAKGGVSAFTAEKLGNLHLSGLALLILAILAKFLFGSWKHSLAVTLLGLVPSIVAVVLTDYSRVVLILPACGVVILIALGIRQVILWRAGYKGFNAVGNVIETADTGEDSLGQRIKNRIAESDWSAIVDKALKPLEKIWEKKVQELVGKTGA